MNVYRKALDIFRQRGGAKGELLDEDTGQVCLIGAVALAIGYKDSDLELDSNAHSTIYKREELRPLHELATEMFPSAFLGYPPGDPGDIWQLNDRIGREAVEQVLEKAAIREEEKV